MPVYVVEEFNDFARYGEAMAPEAGRIVNRTIMRIEARMKVKMGEPKHGRSYRRGKTAKHQASAPGEAPAIDYGVLVNSIGTRMIGRTEGEVSVSAEYAAVLEFGGVRMAPRPFFAVSVEEEWRQFVAEMRALGE